MPLYGVAQAGSQTGANMGLNLTAVGPGETFTLFSGTETPASGTKSVAFMPMTGPTLLRSGITFSMDFGSATTATVLIQAANQDADADYVTVYTSTNTQHDSYADVGGFAFYRANLSSYSSGGMPVVIAKR